MFDKPKIKLHSLELHALRAHHQQRLKIYKSPEKVDKYAQSLDVSPMMDRLVPSNRREAKSQVIIENKFLKAENQKNQLTIKKLVDIIEKQKQRQQQSHQQTRGLRAQRGMPQLNQVKFRSQPDLANEMNGMMCNVSDVDYRTLRQQKTTKQNASVCDIAVTAFTEFTDYETNNISISLPRVVPQPSQERNRCDQLEQTFGKKQSWITKPLRQFPKEIFQGNVSKVKRQFQQN